MKIPTLSILLCSLTLACISPNISAENNKLKIFILAGQSNMQGHCTNSVIENRLKDATLKVGFEKYYKEGAFVERKDVFIKNIENDKNGPLTVGYGATNKKIGPELSFGWTIGDKLDEDVLIIKAAWGGKSLFRDFLSPSGKKPSNTFIQGLEDKAKKKKKPFSKEEYMKEFGLYYRLMMENINETLSDLKTYAPNYKDQGYEIVGFVWFQGYNDKFSDHSTSTYQENMAHFIRDVRKDLKLPQLPFVIGAMGHNGKEQSGTTKILADAQIATAQMTEFKGNVITVETSKFWDYDAGKAFKNKKKDPTTWEKLGSNKAFHYFGSASFFEKTGSAFADAVLELSN